MPTDCKPAGSRCLVVVLGQTRAWNLTWQSFYENLLQPLQADLALCLHDSPLEEKSNPFYRHARYKWCIADTEDMYEQFISAVRRRFELELNDIHSVLSLEGNLFGGIQGFGHRGAGAVLLLLRERLRTELISSELLDTYDTFVITRSDFIYTLKHPGLDVLDSRCIYLPAGEEYKGLTDRHMVVPRKYVVESIDLIGTLFGNVRQTLLELRETGPRINPERAILLTLERNNLLPVTKTIPYIFYTVRQLNGPTAWSAGTWSDRRGYYIKYWTEYYRATQFAIRFRFRKNWSVRMLDCKYKSIPKFGFFCKCLSSKRPVAFAVNTLRDRIRSRLTKRKSTY